ncbi:MAG: hypothetical protein IPG61_02565 [bacterium]|nr:hypothetical protein [bacterium]
MNTAIIIAIAVCLALVPGGGLAGTIVPATPTPSAVAPEYVHFMTRGAPADSFVLRVSLCNESFRNEGHASVIIEELVWPMPEPGIDFDREKNTFTRQVFEPGEYFLDAVLIDGDIFHERAIEIQKATLFVRGHQPPIEFLEWRSPSEFAVRYWDTRFELRRVARGSYELVDVQLMESR